MWKFFAGSIKQFLRHRLSVKWDKNWGAPDSLRIWYENSSGELDYVGWKAADVLIKGSADGFRNGCFPDSWIAEINEKVYFLHAYGWKIDIHINEQKTGHGTIHDTTILGFLPIRADLSNYPRKDKHDAIRAIMTEILKVVSWRSAAEYKFNQATTAAAKALSEANTPEDIAKVKYFLENTSEMFHETHRPNPMDMVLH